MAKLSRLPSRLNNGNSDEEPLKSGLTSAVPNAQKPKSRPPQSKRDRLGFLHGHLPTYSGPYSVGTMEIEVPVQDPRDISPLKRHGQPMLKLETVLMTIYYPSAHGSGSGSPPAGSGKWSRETWLPRPRVGVAHGYGTFAGIGPLAIPFFGATSMFTKLPAFRNARLATHWPPPENAVKGGVEVKNSEGPPPEGEQKQPCFPVMIFSHGLGGTRTMYSSICGEFASYGFVTIAVEHRDGSGPRTYINHPPEDQHETGINEKAANVLGEAVRRKKKYAIVDYYFPKGNRRDTTPNSDKGVDHELRSAQIDLRIAETEEAYHVLCQIVQGNGEEIAKKNLRRQGFAGGSSHGLAGIDWSSWKDRVHLEQVTMVGHSFGAATTVEILRNPKRFPFISQGIILDIWSAGMKPADPENETERRVRLPLLCINSEAFSYWQSNFDPVRKLVEEARAEDALAWLMTIRGTVHINHSDFALLYPNICSLFLKMTADPQRALDLNLIASFEFLKIVMPARLAQINRAMKSEGLLESNVLENFDDLPDEEVNRPHAKWVAARLNIPNELKYRLDPNISKQRRRVRTHRGEGGLTGMGRPSDEVWMHMAPSREQLEKQGVQSKEEETPGGGKNRMVPQQAQHHSGEGGNASRQKQDSEKRDDPQSL